MSNTGSERREIEEGRRKGKASRKTRGFWVFILCNLMLALIFGTYLPAPDRGYGEMGNMGLFVVVIFFGLTIFAIGIDRFMNGAGRRRE